MRNTLIIIALTSCIIICSCSKHKSDTYITQTNDTIHIDPLKATKKIQYSKFIDKINYIVTPTDEEFMIGKVDKLIATDEYFFILDKSITRAIYCIDKKGKKVFTIKNTGTGPGEYDIIRDFTYDEVNKEIIIYCYMLQKLIYYNINGEFIREKKIPFAASKIQFIDSNYLYFAEYERNNRLKKNEKFPNLFLASVDFSILSQSEYFEYPINQAIVWSTDCQFSNWRDTISIKPDHSNIVYHASKNCIIPAYKLNFGEYCIDERYWRKSREEGITLNKMDDYCNNVKLCESFKFLESNKYIYFIYRQNKKLYYVLYSKSTNKMINTKIVENDIDYTTPFDPIAIQDNKMFCLINSENLFLAKKFMKGIIPNKVLNSVQEFGNPVIAIITLKEF